MSENIVVKETKDSAALIVGGTAGIGLHSAFAMAEVGVRRIAVVGRTVRRGEEAREQLAERGVEAYFLPGDARSADAADDIVARAREVLGGLDIMMCTTAADTRPELFKDIPASTIPAILNDLALPAMFMAAAALPGMREQRGGVIVNVASDAAKTATPGESVIGAAKAALVMFTRVLAIEEKRHGIRANVLTPSLVSGTASTERITEGGFSGKLFARAAQQAHLGVATADDIGALAGFLITPAAAKLTGQAISVNGGISAA
ncbi:putative oxidoreductase [Gordonia polyisoprenivorans NBRC 16320 = JCM 10675]|uniref:3-oxoacyl-[acyl-carrier-protein] reductase MabA n=1 Tax=Gordonia polyisoprenivorans TaxID=84595 RepID=A0A846WIB9_9ACTN|nr:SDR family oxidoreductase [Gordonia polyisoprenivorans]NKY01475.1 SDR family oxidoreductase [Gordonia polyisoprenivorans]GAB26356.1 putative oxidoreductase [Gordonia polyisoprenivorans NBRC 16320 = JCM 10675]